MLNGAMGGEKQGERSKERERERERERGREIHSLATYSMSIFIVAEVKTFIYMQELLLELKTFMHNYYM